MSSLANIAGFLAKLGIAIVATTGTETRCLCPFCEQDGKGDGHLYVSSEGLWYCHRPNCPTNPGGTKGGGNAYQLALVLGRDKSDALALLREFGLAIACRRVKAENRGSRPARSDGEPNRPVPNVKRAERFIAYAQGCLLGNPGVQEQWLPHRGIPVTVARRYRLGFVPGGGITILGWQRPVRNTWAIPIPAVEGNVLAVKLHKERPSEGEPKSLWCPFGTQQNPRTRKPRHAYLTLFPPPEWPCEEWNEASERAAIMEFDGGQPRPQAEQELGLDRGWLYLCPGELKALAIIGAGRSATSVTAGESHRWVPATANRLSGSRVCIVFDDDAAGLRFRDMTIAALRPVVEDLKAITFGQKGERIEREA